MLQEDLNATSHSTEELIEKRQILNSVLIQQVSQPWKTQQQEERRQNSGCVIFTRHRRLSRSLLLCTFLQSSCEMFTQQLLLHSSDERFSERGKKKQLRLQISLWEHWVTNWRIQFNTHCVLWSRYVMTLSASSSKRLLTWCRYSGTYKIKGGDISDHKLDTILYSFNTSYLKDTWVSF